MHSDAYEPQAIDANSSNRKRPMRTMLIALACLTLFGAAIATSVAIYTANANAREIEAGTIFDMEDPNKAISQLAKYGVHATLGPQGSTVVVTAEQRVKAIMILKFLGQIDKLPDDIGALSKLQLEQLDTRARLRYITSLEDSVAETIATIPVVSEAMVTFGRSCLPWSFGRDHRNRDDLVGVRVNTARGGRLTDDEQIAIASLVIGAFQSLGVTELKLMDGTFEYYTLPDKGWVRNFLSTLRQPDPKPIASRPSPTQRLNPASPANPHHTSETMPKSATGTLSPSSKVVLSAEQTPKPVPAPTDPHATPFPIIQTDRTTAEM